jgi:hypothetical protein
MTICLRVSRITLTLKNSSFACDFFCNYTVCNYTFVMCYACCFFFA